MLDVRAGPGQPAGDVPVSVCLSTEVKQEVDQTAVSQGRNLLARCKNPSMTCSRDRAGGGGGGCVALPLESGLGRCVRDLLFSAAQISAV